MWLSGLLLGSQLNDLFASTLFNQIVVDFCLILADAGSIWLQWDVILFGVIFLVFVSLGSYGLGMNIRDKRKRELEHLVKERTKELETANNELKVRNSELDRFVYSASHDLSSPLKSILGLINVARLERPEPKQLQYLNMMEKSVDKLELFIGEVIQYSRNARLPIRLETFDFQRLVASILTDYQYVPNFDKIKIDIVDGVNHDITADGMRLRIILNNLISNAIKFHRFNGNVVPEIKISISKNSDHYFFGVEDNGRGIQSEYVEKIFEMFFRATEETNGSGLGLYILKETVSRLEGRIDVKSQVGLGTVFTVTIPIRQLEYSKALL